MLGGIGNLYTDYFGFSNPPFTAWNPRVFVESSAYEEAYACLRRGLTRRSGLLLLTGPSGVGKTTLLHRLRHELDSQIDCIFIWNANQRLDDLIGYVCDSLALDVRSDRQADRIVALEAHLLAQLAVGRRLMVIVDDAQQLPEETLAGLSHLVCLQSAGQSLLQLILSGQPPLAKRLTNELGQGSVAQQSSQICQLNPLTDPEVIHYIREHLQAAGYRGEGLFEENALHKILAYARGLPQLINLICNQALFLAYLNGEPSVSATRIEEVAKHNQLRERPLASALDRDVKPVASVVTLPKLTTARSATIMRGAKPVAMAVADEQHSAIAKKPSPITAYLHRRHRLRFALGLLLLTVSGIFLTIRFIDIEQLVTPLSKALQGEALPGPIPAPKDVHSGVTSEESVEGRIQTLLVKAEQQMQSMAYVLPHGESALDSYREVLQLDPDNPEALQAIARIKASFLEWSDLVQMRGDLAKAREYAEIAVMIDPDDTLAWRRLEEITRKQDLASQRRSD
jgi:general secretion pathway protein A